MIRFTQKSIIMTELNDQYDGVVKYNEIYFSGEGMNSGEHIVLKDIDGAEITRYRITAAAENAFMIQDPSSVRGIRVAEIPSGTVSIFIQGQ